MTNTKFRKRALLSSVAMLLVALVALGSATFAWFTANPNAYAQGVKMRTTASAGLVIRTETYETWSHEAILRNGESDYFNLTPVSQEQSAPANFWTAEAGASNNYEIKSGATMSPAGANDFYAEKVYCRLSDGSDATAAASKKVYLKGVTITAATGATMQNAIRVAIAGPNGLIGTYALATTGAHGTLTGTTPTSGSFSPALAATATNLNEDTGLTALSASGEDLGKYITVYCYLDGQDTLCNSDAVGTNNAAKIIESVKIDLALA